MSYTTELNSVILYVKNEFGNMLVKRKDLIIQLGNAYENVVSNPESICEEIKNALHAEIREKIISPRDIERYCPDKWKKKTKPKNDNLSFSKEQAIVLHQKGNGSSSETIEEDTIELQEHSDNTESWIGNTSGTIDIEFSLTLEDVRNYVVTLSDPYSLFWFNAKVDLRTGKVIAAHTGRIPVEQNEIQVGN
jgi:hypothetical protein